MQRSHVYRSLMRPTQFLGCDRELTMGLCMMCGLVAFAAASVEGAFAALGLFAAGYAALRAMSASDPLAREVYLRSLRYARFYQARESMGGKRDA
jgi:type IV secretory pathway TrbD component